MSEPNHACSTPVAPMWIRPERVKELSLVGVLVVTLVVFGLSSTTTSAAGSSTV